MRKFTLGFMTIATILITSCTSTLDKQLNMKDFTKVQEVISTDTTYSSMKSKYLIDKLTEQIGFIVLGKKMGKEMGIEMDGSTLPTFRKEIGKLSIAFDSIRKAKIEIRNNNEKLDNFIELVAAHGLFSTDRYKGYLSMKLKFNNQFDNEILYIILNYKYINKYDSKFFDEKTKLTDEVAGDFKGVQEVTTTEKYNDVAEFLYTKVPVGEKNGLEFLMEGLKVETLLIVFKDKTQLSHNSADWKYLN